MADCSRSSVVGLRRARETDEAKQTSCGALAMLVDGSRERYRRRQRSVCKTRQKRKERKKVGEGLQWQEEDKATIGALLDVDVDARGKERGEVVS
jgi:hypothetical protein